MGARSQHNMKVFMKRYGKDMIQSLKDTFIFLPIMLAQASAESGYGTSNAAKNKNNFFGVYSGNTLANFNSAYDAFSRQVNMFSNPNLPYISNGIKTAKTPYEQARAIANSGYYSMTNDETLAGDGTVKGTVWNGYTWNGKKWVGSNFNAKQSADHYYNTLKGFIDDALLAFNFGRVDNTNYTSINNSINNNV